MGDIEYPRHGGHSCCCAWLGCAACRDRYHERLMPPSRALPSFFRCTRSLARSDAADLDDSRRAGRV